MTAALDLFLKNELGEVVAPVEEEEEEEVEQTEQVDETVKPDEE